MARYESAALGEFRTAYWTTKDGHFAIRVVDDDSCKEVGLSMPEAMKLAAFIVECAAEYLD